MLYKKRRTLYHLRLASFYRCRTSACFVWLVIDSMSALDNCKELRGFMV